MDDQQIRDYLAQATGPLASLGYQEKQQALGLLSAQVADCLVCRELASTRTQTVFGVGHHEPSVCFVGEAPGADEDKQGQPFVGRAGQLLDRILQACRWQRDEVYITNILKCRPPNNRNPLPQETTNCLPYLVNQLQIIKPRTICALGAIAAQTLLNTSIPIGKLRGQFHNFNGIPLICTYHPAYLLRNQSKKVDVWQDMQMLMKHLGQPLPT